MKKNTSKNSVKSGDQASVTSDAITPLPSASSVSPTASISLEVVPKEELLPDQSKQTAESDNKPLTAPEEEDLKRCETVIEENKASYVETCAAMDEIWSKRLFRIQYKSFKEYCAKKWGFSRAYGYRLISSHKTIQKVSTMVDTSHHITSGTQAAELAKVPQEKQADVFMAAKSKAGAGKVTSHHIKEAAEEVKADTVQEKKEFAPIAAQRNEPTTAKIITPGKFTSGAKLVPFAELRQMAEKAYNIHTDSARRKELEHLLHQLKAQIRLREELENTNLAQAPLKMAA